MVLTLIRHSVLSRNHGIEGWAITPGDDTCLTLCRMSTPYKKEGGRKECIRRLILEECMTIKHSNKKYALLLFSLL